MSAVSLENIIRPFSPVQVRPTIYAPRPEPVLPGIKQVKLGGSGGKSVSFTFNNSGSVVDDNNKFQESSRKSSKVKIENEDDPDQFVEFCRADSITLRAKNKDSQPPRTSSYDTSGGTHDFGNNLDPSAGGSQELNFQYPKEKTCKDPGGAGGKGPC